MTGPFETNINLKGSTSGEMSILLDQVFHKVSIIACGLCDCGMLNYLNIRYNDIIEFILFQTPEHLWISIPLVEEISMFLTPKFNVTMDAHMDIKVTGSGEFQLGHDQTGNLTIGKLDYIVLYELWANRCTLIALEVPLVTYMGLKSYFMDLISCR